MPQQWGVRVRATDLQTIFMSSCLAYVGLGGCAWLGDKTKKTEEGDRVHATHGV